MTIAVFSDTHLRLPFEEKKFRFLEKLINKSAHVIIVGDFWDGYIITFTQFLNSPWRHLFPLLKRKKTIYIFGNHDKEIFVNEKVNLFSKKQVKQYQLKLNGKNFVFEHGDRLVPALDGILKIKKPPTFLQKRLIKLHDQLLEKKGKRFLEWFFKKTGEKIKKKMESEFKDSQFLIAGHTHYPEIDEKNRFANCGTIGGGFASYLLIDEEGRIKLKEERY